ncbi:MAG: hypothetical protein IPH35_15005 [Rhodoferax sp.]|nr:hypothetical protein [Rhodoferax sp.]
MSIFDATTGVVGKLTALKKEMFDLLQDPMFDSISYVKLQQLETKLQSDGLKKIGTVFFGNDLKNVRTVGAGRRYNYLPEGFFSAPSLNPPADSIFILTNNDIGSTLPTYVDFYQSNPQALFVIWDWDSQHWTYMSSMVAMYSDFYISGGSENAYFLSHFNPNVLGPVFGGAYQWTREFILQNIDTVLAERSNDPLGVHYFYANYPRRNRAIASVMKAFPSVRFGNNDYKKRTDLENFQEWCGHKTHWVMPVLGGLPLRGYNAMITGGIPVLPSFLKNFPEVSILGDLPLYYEVADLIDPVAIQEAAVKKFDSFGKGGLIQRVLDGLEKYHVDARCEHILKLVESAVAKVRVADRSYSDGYYGMGRQRG